MHEKKALVQGGGNGKRILMHSSPSSHGEWHGVRYHLRTFGGLLNRYKYRYSFIYICPTNFSYLTSSLLIHDKKRSTNYS